METPNNKEVDEKKKQERKQEKDYAGGGVKEVMSEKAEGLSC